MYGLAAIGAQLFESASLATPEDSAEVIAAELVTWITEHEQDLGLPPGLDDSHVELIPADGFVQRMGGLTILRFVQRHRSWPLLPPHDLVQVVVAGTRAVQLTGRIVDGRVDYEDEAAQAHERLALGSIRQHVHERTGYPIGEIEVDGLALVAVPESQRIAWVGHARYAGSMLARVIVGADVDAPGPVLELLSYRTLEVEDLVTTAPIQVRTADPSTDPAAFGTSVETTLAGGGALLGSIDDVSGEVQLATDAVVVLDLNGGSRQQLEIVASRILDPDGDFLATNGSAFSGQLTHHLMHSWYALIDEYLTDPVSGTKQWDSAVPVYQPGAQSPTPPGTFMPRMLAFINSASSDCPTTAVACANWIGYGSGSPAAMAFPEIVHHPPSAAPDEFEFTGRITTHPPGGNGDDVFTLAHEFGHVADLFLGPGITKHLAPECNGPCTLECLEDTSQEAPPLGETIAQMFALLLLHDAFELVDFEYCNIISVLSRHNVKAFGPGPCIPVGEDISLLQRPGPGSCDKTAPYCDKPDEPKVNLHCCEPGVEPDCIIPAAMTDCDSGFQRAVPTGVCNTSPGYDTHSVMQAFWQMLNGQYCEPTAPFDCQSFEWVSDVDPADVVIPAFLYSLRLNPLSYEQLVDGMATHVACNHGTDAYDHFNAIACAHDLRDCTEDPPVLCQTCGNGVREGTETCDGLDWAAASCSDWGDYMGGELQCDANTCQLEASLCTNPEQPEGLDSTAGTGHDPSATTTAPAATETEGAWPGASGDDGCACQAAHRRIDPLWLLMPLACIGRRRRRSS
ncbi:hypothetical protein [Paraliomyxa miuraensis]|uniref:hypothetical protein n=1 Tax=Paraliomyxa miuraensis TaxID=376150 RepID=UPI00224C7D0C|nr:hypothetical protein [Paraliomyxa miuraensis]MCX4244405.1 hypothetical protein [Paraliomyxa miuraensis]